MTKQARKHSMGMAGEFLVAGELLRRGVSCSVTYGNAKKADVIAFSGAADRVVALEVKTTANKKWVVGSSMPKETEDLWVFVFLPPDESKPPEFFILSAAELHGILAPNHDEYRRRYRAKHGKEFVGGGVETITHTQAEFGRNQWQKLLAKLN